MPPTRLNPERPQTGPERARRSREARDAYVAALERAVVDAAQYPWMPNWQDRHAFTIVRARASRQEAEE